MSTSSYRDGGSGAFFFQKIRSNAKIKDFFAISITTIHQMVFTFCAHIFALVFWSRILRLNLLTFLGKLYVFPIESAFKYSHQLNRNESSNGFHILRSHFKFTYSVAFSENYGSVTFSENRKSMMSFHRDFPVE